MSILFSLLNDNRVRYSDVYYEHGTYIHNTIPAFAILTGGNKTITVYVPLGRQINPSDTVTINHATLSGLRKPSGGYIDDSGSDRTSLITSPGFKNVNTALLYINFTKTSNWDSVNNIPLTGTVNITFTIS